MQNQLFISKNSFNPEKKNKKFWKDVNKAFELECEVIQSAEGNYYGILPTLHGLELVGMGCTNEQVDDPDLTEGYVESHNLLLIDQIINNTLKQNENVTPQQADTMLKLAHLKEVLK